MRFQGFTNAINEVLESQNNRDEPQDYLLFSENALFRIVGLLDLMIGVADEAIEGF